MFLSRSTSFFLGKRSKATHAARPSARRRALLEVEPLENRLVPALVAPVLNSNLGAPLSLYLDFDGHVEERWFDTEGNEYNTTTLGDSHLDGVHTLAFDLDGHSDSFSQRELNVITEVFQRVTEDYAPFNINVTTVEPSADAFAAGTALRVAIGGHYDDWYGRDSTGVGKIGSFTDGSQQYVVYVFSESIEEMEMQADEFPDNDGRPVQLRTALANTVSHEAGHAFGLKHQLGLLPEFRLQLYYPGTEEWTPIMGDNTVSDRTTWYYGVIGQDGQILYTQDDMDILAQTLGYRPDDNPDVTPLRIINLDVAPLPGGRLAQNLNILAGTRESSTTLSGSGIIEQATDEDAFSFHTEKAGTVHFTVAVAAVGPNLDAKVEIRDLEGNVLVQVDPADRLGVTLDAYLPAGDYHLVVMSHGGSYADETPFHTYDVGQYTIRGTIGGGRLESNVDPITKGELSLWPRDDPRDDPRWGAAVVVPSLQGPRENAVTIPPALVSGQPPRIAPAISPSSALYSKTVDRLFASAFTRTASKPLTTDYASSTAEVPLAMDLTLVDGLVF